MFFHQMIISAYFFLQLADSSKDFGVSIKKDNNWRASSVQKYVREYLSKEACNTCVEEVSSDDNGVENIEAKEKDHPDITIYEALGP